MTFQLDTSGHVQGWVPPHGERRGYAGPNHVLWSDLDPFTQGYVEAALSDASAVEKRGNAYVTPNSLKFSAVIRPYAFSDLAPETLARIVEDCAKATQLGRPYISGRTRGDGFDFWTLRQDRVSHVQTFPPLAAHLGDDGKVYLREVGA